jgi:hypothetical protein
MREVLEAADAAQKAGKIGHFALSNESAWGTAQWLRIAEEAGLPRVQSIQNEYSLLCRLYDTDLAELAVNEKVTLLAYSPLAAGLLTGKYQGDVVPKGSRRENGPELFGRVTDRAFAPSMPISTSRTATGSTRFTWRWPSRCSGPSRSPRSSGRPRRSSWRISWKGLDVTLVAGGSGGDRRDEPGDADALLRPDSVDKLWIDRKI